MFSTVNGRGILQKATFTLNISDKDRRVESLPAGSSVGN